MVFGSAQLGARGPCSCICRQNGFVCWRLHWRCAVVQRGCHVLMVTCDVVSIVCERPSVAPLSFSVSCALLQVTQSMLWTYTTATLGRGQRLSSAWRAMVLQLHLSETLRCSLEVPVQVRCIHRLCLVPMVSCWFVLSACERLSVALLIA